MKDKLTGEAGLGAKTITQIKQSRQLKSYNQIRLFNELLASKRGSSRFKILTEFSSEYLQVAFGIIDPIDGRVIKRFKLEPYIMLESMVSIKSIMGKKREIKTVRDKIEEALGVNVFYEERRTKLSPFVYSIFVFDYQGQRYNVIYEDETCFKKGRDGQIEKNMKYTSYSQKLNYEKVKSPYYKKYIKDMVLYNMGKKGRII